jgi:hypothetical protein
MLKCVLLFYTMSIILMIIIIFFSNIERRADGTKRNETDRYIVKKKN